MWGGFYKVVFIIELIMFCEYGCCCWVVFVEFGKFNIWGFIIEFG